MIDCISTENLKLFNGSILEPLHLKVDPHWFQPPAVVFAAWLGL